MGITSWFEIRPEAPEVRVKRGSVILLLIALLVGLAWVLVVAFAPADVQLAWQYVRTSLAIAGIGSLTALGTLLAGCMVGFLFGIPRTLQGAASGDGGRSYQVNTNLEQISDWLTKIIVGVTLVQLREIPRLVMELNAYLAPALGGGRRGEAFAGSIIVYFGILGFFIGYIGTRLYLAGAFVRADDELTLRDLLNSAQPSITAAAEADPKVPRSELSASALVENAEITSLAEYAQQRKPGVHLFPPQVARQLALSLYLTRRYAEAIPYFERANQDPLADPDFTLQHAIALGELGRHEDAVRLLEPLVAVGKGGPAAKKLLAYNLLWNPNRLIDAIRVTQEYLAEVGGADAGALFNLACAHAQLYGITKDAKHRDAAIDSLQRTIRQDLRWRERAHQLRREDFASLSDEEFARAVQ